MKGQAKSGGLGLSERRAHNLLAAVGLRTHSGLVKAHEVIILQETKVQYSPSQSS